MFERMVVTLIILTPVVPVPILSTHDQASFYLLFLLLFALN